jgi:hypothetical protein
MMTEWRGSKPQSDVGARVVDELLFRFLVDLEVQKAQRLRYCVSLVCLAAEIAPAETRERSLPSFSEILIRYIRTTDVVAASAPASLTLLLVDAETAHLPSILRRLTALLGSTVWSAGGSCYPKTATRADDMLRQAVESMIRAKQSGGNRFYVGS